MGIDPFSFELDENDDLFALYDDDDDEEEEEEDDDDDLDEDGIDDLIDNYDE